MSFRPTPTVLLALSLAPLAHAQDHQRPATARARGSLGIHRADLASAGSRRLELALPDGRRAALSLEGAAAGERSATGGRTWRGRLGGEAEGFALFAAHGDALAGLLVEDGATWKVRTSPTGELLASTSELGGAGAGCERVEVPRSAFPERASAASSAVGSTAPQSAAPGPVSVVELLVAWTAEAEAAAGGSDEVQALIDLAVLETNLVFANSEVDLDLRLVHASRIDYPESGSQATDLDRLRDPADGFMDEVHVWRDAVGADAVTLFIANNDKCGRSYNMTAPATTGFAPYAFELVAASCAVGSYTLAHELGHTFGLDHDRVNANGTPTRPYAFGHWTANGLYRTVMALPRWGITGTRLPYYSNPRLKYGNQELGIPMPSSQATDCAQALEDNKPVLTAWRPTSVVPTLIKPSCTVGQLLLASEEVALEQDIEIMVSSPDDDVPAGALPVIVLSAFPAGVTCGAFPTLDDMLVSLVLYEVEDPWQPGGAATTSVHVPNVPSLVGLSINAQALFFDLASKRILPSNSRTVTIVP